jgi:tRNA A-37 threonylcarbamoyl transferase component Bud32
MISTPSALVMLAASCLVTGLLVAGACKRRWPRRPTLLEIAPGYRSVFRRLGLTDPEAFLELPGAAPHIVSGHPDRHVVRVQFGSGAERLTAFLKREHRVTWRTRLANVLAGFGFVSRSVREGRTLQVLQRENLPGPFWLAAGEDSRGRAFVLVREVNGAELRVVLRDERSSTRRRRIARNLGETLGRLHAAGFVHPDLYANHLFVDPGDDSVRILDWQRARLTYLLSWQQRRRDLASLHATLDDALATPRERLVFLRAYRRRPAGLRPSPGACSRGGTFTRRGSRRANRKPGSAWIATSCVRRPT